MQAVGFMSTTYDNVIDHLPRENGLLVESKLTIWNSFA
jgi:hypothetical protein